MIYLTNKTYITPIITPIINIIHIKWGLNLQLLVYVLVTFFAYHISITLDKAQIRPNIKGYITKFISTVLSFKSLTYQKFYRSYSIKLVLFSDYLDLLWSFLTHNGFSTRYSITNKNIRYILGDGHKSIFNLNYHNL